MSRPVSTLLLLALSLLGCAASTKLPSAPRPEPRLLTHAQAVLAIQEALIEAGALVERSFALTLADGRPLDADVRFGTPPFAIDWTTREEREKLGALLPAGGEGDALRIVTAQQGSVPVQVLVLDAEAYGYEGDSLLVQRGAPGIEEAELRVRRDVAYFVEYVRDQGGQP
jgi:hypothetical protein